VFIVYQDPHGDRCLPLPQGLDQSGSRVPKARKC